MRDTDLTRAGFGPRAAAYLIDRALLLIGLGILRLPFAISSLLGWNTLTARNFLFRFSFVDVLCWVAVSAYFVLMTWFTGATLGKMVMRLRVRQADGEVPRFITVLYRETVGRFLSGILCLGYLMVLADRDKRGFHDWLCDTCVVYDGVTLRARGPAPAPENPGWSAPGAANSANKKLPSPLPHTPGASLWSIPGAGVSAPEDGGGPEDLPPAPEDRGEPENVPEAPEAFSEVEPPPEALPLTDDTQDAWA